jgi:protein involved in polysaccharide export with SLBB domain
MLSRTRLAESSLVTAAAYLAATLWSAAPAAAQSDEGGGAPVPAAQPIPRSPAAPPDAGGILMDDVLDPALYVVGPGDLFALMFYGASNFSHRLRVDPRSRLFVPNVGFIDLRGKTLAAAETLIGQKVRAAYPRLSNGLVLLAPRRFLVQVAGLVKNPEAYEVTALTRVSAVIARAGGRLPGASQRRIEVRRAGKVLLADLQPFYLEGDRRSNPYLLEGDVVYVRPAVREVTVEGAVHRPGTYELADEGTYGELIRLAGGLHPDASERLNVRVIRRVRADDVQQIVLSPPRSAGLAKTRLEHGDRVVVPGVQEAVRTVLIQGAVGTRDKLGPAADKLVDNPAASARELTLTVPFFDGDTVRSVLERAGGLLPWADARNASIERRDEQGKPTRVPVDAYALLVLRDITRDVAVKAGDVIYVPAERESVMVSGPANRPGLYQYNPRFRALDYINLAGGPTPQGSISGSQLITKSGKLVKVDETTPVQPGDTISLKVKSLTTFEWTQIFISVASLFLSASAIVIATKQYW